MKPIFLNTEMVRAILDGRRTQTRRVVKPQPQSYLFDGRGYIFDEGELPKPQYQPGDILWVRETWCANNNPHSDNCGGFEYRADYEGALCQDLISWHSSIHMPKKAARLFLRVTDVRVERLQDVKNADCVSEGAVKRPDITKRGDLVLHSRYRMEFADLWDSTIKPANRDRYGWNANPWVWVISFERYDPADPEGGADNGQKS